MEYGSPWYSSSPAPTPKPLADSPFTASSTRKSGPSVLEGARPEIIARLPAIGIRAYNSSFFAAYRIRLLIFKALELINVVHGPHNRPEPGQVGKPPSDGPRWSGWSRGKDLAREAVLLSSSVPVTIPATRSHPRVQGQPIYLPWISLPIPTYTSGGSRSAIASDINRRTAACYPVPAGGMPDAAAKRRSECSAI